MKKLIFLLPLLLMACKKDAPINNNVENKDSVAVSNTPPAEVSADEKDSIIAHSKAVEKVLDEGINRDVIEGEIVRTADASMLPFTIGDQFTNDGQKFTLKLKNVSKSNLNISVKTKAPMNIRINQIKYPDGSFDGPYGQTLNLKTPQKGEYWIILGKNLMADGNAKGHFSIKVN